MFVVLPFMVAEPNRMTGKDRSAEAESVIPLIPEEEKTQEPRSGCREEETQ